MYSLVFKKSFSHNGSHSSLWMKFIGNETIMADGGVLCRYNKGELVPIYQFDRNIYLMQVAQHVLHILLYEPNQFFLWRFDGSLPEFSSTELQIYYENSKSEFGSYFIKHPDSPREIGIFDFKKNCPLFKGEKKSSYIIANGNLFLSLASNDLLVYRFSDAGDQLWSCQLPNRPFWQDNTGPDELINDKITKIIGIHNALIWVATMSGSIYAINIDTGKIIYGVQNPDQEQVKDIWKKKFLTGKTQYSLKDVPSITKSVEFETSEFDAKNNMIFGLWMQKYWEFDVHRPNESLRVVDMGGYLKQKNYQSLDFVSNSLPFDDEYIYTCESYQGIIVAINRKTLEIDWSYEIDIEPQGLLRKILTVYYHNNQLFVVDRENTLYVFEKTNAST
ncbi:hypothetical protein [Haliscomenobacter sp.]|uniref:hypothetical protein n=1 Tax=Haliscomenobacter sp. TaxID=2717303 RepID=UPI003364E512